MFFIKNLIHKLLNKQISNIYSERFKHHHDTPKGVFWNNTLSQDLRLNIILDKIIIISKSSEFSIADIGCGYGRLLKIIKERNFQKTIYYHGYDINKDFILFCKKHKKSKYINFQIQAYPSKKVDFVIMSGTYNLTPTNNIKLWENYIIENLKSNWEFVNEAMIFNCLVGSKPQIKNNLYYSELSWIKKICEYNFGKLEISKNNLLPHDITITIKKLS